MVVEGEPEGAHSLANDDIQALLDLWDQICPEPVDVFEDALARGSSDCGMAIGYPTSIVGGWIGRKTPIPNLWPEEGEEEAL